MRIARTVTIAVAPIVALLIWPSGIKPSDGWARAMKLRKALLVLDLMVALALTATHTSLGNDSALLYLPAGNAILVIHGATYTGVIAGNGYRAMVIGHGGDGWRISDGVLDNG